MPLNKQALKTSLSKFMDPDAEGFEGSPKNTEEFADKFSKAINDYAASIVPPADPDTLPAATAALKTALLAVGDPDKGKQLFNIVITAAMATYAGVVAVGMGKVSSGAVVAAPPVDPLGVSIFTNVFPLGMAGEPASVCVEEMAATIDGWFKTGTAAIGGASATLWQ